MTHFDVDKDAAKVKFKLDKKGLPKIVAEVIATLDLSGSMKNMYSNGTVQEAIQRVIPVALNFDDNGSVPVYGFNDGENIVVLDEITKGNYKDYVKREIMDGLSSDKKWGGTDYAPVLKLALGDLGFYARPREGKPTGGFLGMFKKTEAIPETLRATSNSRLPSLLYHFTDGENTGPDQAKTRDLLRKCASTHCAIYFNFIGVGHANFSFLKSVADELPNVGFTQILDLTATAGSDDIYDHLLPDEMLDWLKSYVK